MVIVEIAADSQTRALRILGRDPQPSAQEVAYRLLDTAASTAAFRMRPDVVIHNGRPHEERSPALFSRLLAGIGGT